MTVMTQQDRLSLLKHNLNRALAAIAAERFTDALTYLKELEAQSEGLRESLEGIVKLRTETGQ